MEYVDKIANILSITIDEVKEYGKEINGLEVYYCCNPIKGGGSIFVEKNGDFLFWTSLISYDTAIIEFKSGKRSGNLNTLEF